MVWVTAGGGPCGWLVAVDVPPLVPPAPPAVEFAGCVPLTASAFPFPLVPGGVAALLFCRLPPFGVPALFPGVPFAVVVAVLLLVVEFPTWVDDLLLVTGEFPTAVLPVGAVPLGVLMLVPAEPPEVPWVVAPGLRPFDVPLPRPKPTVPVGKVVGAESTFGVVPVV